MFKKIIFVVPDGTGIKNYLFSDILPQLYKDGVEVLIYHNLSESAISEVEKLHGLKLNQRKIPTYNESKKQKFYREAICYARLLYNAKTVNNPTILTNWKTSHTGFKKIFYKTVEVYGKYLCKNYKNISRLTYSFEGLKGNYLVKISNTKGKTSVFKLIKQ